MRRASLAVLMAALSWPALSCPALAKAAKAPAPAGVFVSPSGEPFRPTAAAPDPFATWFARVDANHDRRIDRAEFEADARAFFKTLDANGDGVIDGFEVTAYETKVAPELAARAEGHGPDTLLDDPEPVSGADLDLTSRITQAGWLRITERRFDLLDKKRQGFLDHGALLTLLPKPRRPRTPP